MPPNGMTDRMNLGKKWNFYFPGAKGFGAATHVLTVNLSMRCSGFCERERLGGPCRRATGIGRIPIVVFVADATKEFGNAFWRN